MDSLCVQRTRQCLALLHLHKTTPHSHRGRQASGRFQAEENRMYDIPALEDRMQRRFFCLFAKVKELGRQCAIEDFGGPARAATASRMPLLQGQRHPVRRTTPVYKRFDQAHASITGSTNRFRFPSSNAGPDFLNDVYTRAVQKEPIPSVMPNVGAVSPSNIEPVEFPLQQTLSPQNEEHMDVRAGDNNPAGFPSNADGGLHHRLLRMQQHAHTSSTRTRLRGGWC